MSDLDTALRDLLDGFQSRLQTWPAILGDGNGLVAVPNLVKRVYVRMPDGHAAVVYNDDRVPLTNNLPVVVGYDYINPNLFQVLGIRQTFKANENAGYASLGMHHESHEYLADHGGQDVVNVHARQLLPGRLSVVSGLTVGVYSSPVWTSAGWKSAALSSISLATHVPGSGARYVLVCEALDGSLTATSGSAVAARTYLQWSDIPTPPANQRPLGAVALEHGQTAITEDRERQDIVDLRFPTFRAWPVVSTTAPLALSATASSGSGAEAAAWDHAHTHGDLLGGSLHATATSASAGFMPNLPNDSTKFYDGAGNWSVPPGGGGTPSDNLPTTAGSPGGPGVVTEYSRGDHRHSFDAIAPLSYTELTGQLAHDAIGTPGTYTKVTTDAQGHVTSGSTLDAGDIPALAYAPTTRTISATAPLTGGGDLSADRTLAISAATSASPGSMSAADKAKLDGIEAGATNIPLSDANPGAINLATPAPGTSGSASRADHVHDHGNLLAGGPKHGLANTVDTGFMPILSNVSTEFLNGAGNWATPTCGAALYSGAIAELTATAASAAGSSGSAARGDHVHKIASANNTYGATSSQILSTTASGGLQLDRLLVGNLSASSASAGDVLAAGRVGIGISPAVARIHVSEPSLNRAPSLTYNAIAALIVDNALAQIAMGTAAVTPYAFWMQTRVSGDAAWPLAINPLGGAVGIGTGSPVAKLSINGGLHVGGDTDPGDNNLLVDGSVNAASAYQRSGTSGYILVQVTPFSPTDTGGTLWSAASRNVGTYSFDMSAVANGGYPAVKGWKMLVTVNMATIADGNGLNFRDRGGATNLQTVRAQVASITNAGTVDVWADANGDFDVLVAGATGTCLLRIIGYYL